MHENLKYTLKLDEEIKEFKSFKDKDPLNEIDRAEISDWQAIFADNKYGTHYLIYAKFLGNKKGDAFEVSRIQLYIQNYSGAVSLGFVNHATIEKKVIKDDDPDMDARFPNRRKFYFQIGLQGLNKKKSTYSFDLNEKLILRNGDIIMTDPIFVPVDNKISKIFDGEEMKNSDFVDEIFMKRLGSDVFISQKGEDLLNELAMLEKGLIKKEDLERIGIELDPAINPFTPSALTNYNLREKRGRRPFLCIPIYSVCEIKK